MIIQAIRYTLPDSDEAFDVVLKGTLIDMLGLMLRDTDLENRRLALTTLNSASHNKRDLIIPNLGLLLPLVMQESIIKPELIREVTMGPFKHKIDDGLEVRKVGPYLNPLVFKNALTFQTERIRDPLLPHGDSFLSYQHPGLLRPYHRRPTRRARHSRPLQPHADQARCARQG